MNIPNFQLATINQKAEKRLLGIKGWFLKGEKRERVLASKIVNFTIKEYQKNGATFSNDEIDKIKFTYDPIFKDKVIENIKKAYDTEYQKNVNAHQEQLTNLKNTRKNEIESIEKSRWIATDSKKFKYNLTEGKAIINDTTVLFSSIKGAEIHIVESYRLKTKSKGKSKKHASLGGAVAGGILGGGIGAVVGGSALGKTTHKTKINTDNIPTAARISVIVDLDGFKNELIILDKTVDQNSHKFQKACEKAQDIIMIFRQLSVTPVPESFLLAEEEPSVIEMNNKILIAKKELEKAIANKPTYALPEKYL